MTGRAATVAATLLLAACGERTLTSIRAPSPPPDGTPDAGAPPDGGCPAALVGFAAQGSGTIGGQGGMEVTVTTALDLAVNASLEGPVVISVDGMLDVPLGRVAVASQKTIVGVGPASGLRGGGFDLADASDIIIQNLVIEKVVKRDAIEISNASHVWIDHCDLSSDRDHDPEYYDGLVDVVHGSHDVTVSWTRFHDHFHTSLAGGSPKTGDEDAAISVTYHHNVFERTYSYNPLIRFGVLHAFNNLYRDVASVGISARMGARVLAEANVFDDAKRPLLTHEKDDETEGLINDRGNLFLDGSDNADVTQTTDWAPPYAYTPDAVDAVAALVAQCAGTKLPGPYRPHD